MDVRIHLIIDGDHVDEIHTRANMVSKDLGEKPSASPLTKTKPYLAAALTMQDPSCASVDDISMTGMGEG